MQKIAQNQMEKNACDCQKRNVVRPCPHCKHPWSFHPVPGRGIPLTARTMPIVWSHACLSLRVMSVTARGDLRHSVLSVLELCSNGVLIECQRAQDQRKEKSSESKRSNDGNPVLLPTGDKPRFSNGAHVECKLRIPSRRGTEREGDRRHHGPRHLYRPWNAEPACWRYRCG